MSGKPFRWLNDHADDWRVIAVSSVVVFVLFVAAGWLLAVGIPSVLSEMFFS